MDDEALDRIEKALVAAVDSTWDRPGGQDRGQESDLAAFRALRADNARLAAERDYCRDAWTRERIAGIRRAEPWHSYDRASALAEAHVAMAMKVWEEAAGGEGGGG